MEFKQRNLGRYTILEIHGEVLKPDASNKLDLVFDKLIADGIKFVALHLGHVPYMDTSGINSIIRLKKHLGKTGRLVIMAPNPATFETLDIIGIDKIIEVYFSEEEFKKMLG